MAIDKNSNVYTYTFTIIMVIVVGASLSALYGFLRPIQIKNEITKKKMDIVQAIGFSKTEATRDNASEMFDQYVVKRISINYAGEIVTELTSQDSINPANKLDPFNIDVKKEYKNKIQKKVNKNKKDPVALEEALSAVETSYPMFICEKNDTMLTVIPLVGTGLWGPIWGYVALMDDNETIYGAKFDHAGETPGLGAEIKEDFFTVKFKGEKLNVVGNKLFSVIKGGQTPSDHEVDGITGGTITSKGVDEMMNRTIKVYLKYLNSNN
jgi:Na+-transporting NADH:ubiquinone oxidoreductase subunit C